MSHIFQSHMASDITTIRQRNLMITRFLLPDFPAWSGIKTLHKFLPTENKKLIDCKDTMQMLVAKLSKEYKQYFTHQGRDDFMAMFCHPFMAHHGPYVMMDKVSMCHKWAQL